MKPLRRRTLDELWDLEATVSALAAERNAAVRRLAASRLATTAAAQREFWLEFSWVDQEYRVAVRRIAEFCARYRDATATADGAAS